jgi:TPP-dependent pyruvate/acetoin dehydrogenase alpha subunit
MLGHAQHDSQKYMAPEELDEWSARDPIRRFERVLVDEGWLSESGCEEIRTAVDSELAAAVDQVLAEEHPEPDAARTRVFADPADDPEVPWTRVSPIGYADLSLSESRGSQARTYGGGR